MSDPKSGPPATRRYRAIRASPGSQTAPPSRPRTLFSVTALYSPLGSNYALSLEVSFVSAGWFHKGVAEAEQHANGLDITILGPQCIRGSCRAVELVSNGRVDWELRAISP